MGTRGAGGRGWGAGALLGLMLALAPAAANAGDLVVLRDGRPVRVERAEELPDRVRVVTTAGRTVELPRQDVLAVFPVPDLPGAARPHAERYGDITRQLTEQVRRDLQQSWSLPASSIGAPSLRVPQVPSGPSGSLPESPRR